MSNSPPSSIFRRYRLSQAGEDGMLLIWNCIYCRRRRVYWAADLVLVYPDMAIEDFGHWCGRCQRSDGVSVHTHYPGQADVGRLALSRPIGWTKDWHWGTEWLDLPVRPLPDMTEPATELDLARRKRPPETPKFERWDKVQGYARPRTDSRKPRP